MSTTFLPASLSTCLKWKISFHFFMKWECWCKVLCLINCNHEKNVSIFFDGKTLIHPSDFLTFNVNFPDHCKVSLIRSSGNTFFMLNGRSVPSASMRVFWLKIIVVCIFTFQLECQVKICCLTSDTSDIVNGLFRKNPRHGGEGDWRSRIWNFQGYWWKEHEKIPEGLI